MARLTGRFHAMPTFKLVRSAPIMVEAPKIPRTHVMAILTANTKLEFVPVILLVTSHTLLRCLPVAQRRMTTLAGDILRPTQHVQTR